jgi:hypothetical protein
MKKLLKIYGFNSEIQYFEMIAESFLNGQYTQGDKQFKAMPKPYRVSMLKHATGNWQSGMSRQIIDRLFDIVL